MREGEPFMPNVMGEVAYYADRVRSTRHPEWPGMVDI
jgi:hypothetical protein